ARAPHALGARCAAGRAACRRLPAPVRGAELRGGRRSPRPLRLRRATPIPARFRALPRSPRRGAEPPHRASAAVSSDRATPAPADSPPSGMEQRPERSEADEAYLASVLERALDELAEGIEPDLDELAAGRPHLALEISELVAKARASANCRPPVR